MVGVNNYNFPGFPPRTMTTKGMQDEGCVHLLWLPPPLVVNRRRIALGFSDSVACSLLIGDNFMCRWGGGGGGTGVRPLIMA